MLGTVVFFYFQTLSSYSPKSKFLHMCELFLSEKDKVPLFFSFCFCFFTEILKTFLGDNLTGIPGTFCLFCFCGLSCFQLNPESHLYVSVYDSF